MRTTILVDCDTYFRLGIRTALEESREFAIVGEARTETGALSLASEIEPELIIVGVNLVPLGYGEELVASLHQRSPKSRILAYVADGEPENPARIEAAGAWMCLSKRADVEQVVAAAIACFGV